MASTPNSGPHWYIYRRGVIDRRFKWVVVGEEENSYFSFSRSASELADVFEKNEKKNKTTSVYRLFKHHCQTF